MGLCGQELASVEKMLKLKSTAAFPCRSQGRKKRLCHCDAKTLGSTSAEELWKKATAEEAEPRPLKIRYSVEHENEFEETTLEHVVETVFEDPNEAAERPRLLVPLHSVLGLKALCEREFIRTEAVTEMLNQCRTAYYKELLYLREQLILAAEPEKQMMMLQVNVSLPSGRSESLLLSHSSKVGDLRILAQKSFRRGFLRLVSSDGHPLIDPKESLEAAGILDGGHVTAVALEAKVAASHKAFAMWCRGGDRVLTWGGRGAGGDCAAVQDQLRNVQQVQATGNEFAAILADGSVVSWGNPLGAGDSSTVQDQLRNVQQVVATYLAFAAILADGSVVTWGIRGAGGDSSAVQDQLKNVQRVQATSHAFAAILADGSVVTWGNPGAGGDSTAVQDHLKNVQQVQATCSAFAAILADGSVVTWGSSKAGGAGGDCAAVQDQLRNVQQVQATREAFAAILAEGSVVTWGNPGAGGDSTAVKDQLKNVHQVQATDFAFAAILADGSVVSWGDPDDGGDSSAVQDRLRNVHQVQATRSAFAAILADGSVVTWGNPDAGGVSSSVQERLTNVQQVQATREAFAAILADGSVVTWGNQALGGDSSEIHSLLISLLGAVQNYEVYFFNPPAYVDEDLKEYMLNCSRWTHKKLIEENYELQMKLSGAGQNDVFDNADFCLKGLLRRHGTYKLFKTFHSVVSHAKDLFNPEDMIRRQEKEGLKPIDELQVAITELFPDLRSREDNSGALLSEIDELQRALTDAKTELSRLKGLLESERNRSEELAKKCDDQERMLQAPAKVAEVVDKSKEKELEELQEKMQQEVDAQAERMSKMIKDMASEKSYELGTEGVSTANWPWDLKTFTRTSLGHVFSKLLTADGRVLADPLESLEAAGLQDGEEITAVACPPKLAATARAFAMWCLGGDGIVTWGDPSYGGNSSDVQDLLKGVRQVQGTKYAFAAIVADGSVVTWGNPHYGGKSSAVQDQLRDVEQIQATKFAFAALLATGRVVTWGDPDWGGDSSRVEDLLRDVKHLQVAGTAFAAILADGSLVMWGKGQLGGHWSAAPRRLTGVKQFQATDGAFAAILEDGSAVAWGNPRAGGDSSAIQDQLRNVQKLQATLGAFAAILADGSVVAWGSDEYGGDSSEVQSQLQNVHDIQATERAFAATGQGSVVLWGDPPTSSGGDTFEVLGQLRNVQEFALTDRAIAAILIDRSVVTFGDPAFGGDRRSRKDASKVFPKLDEAIADLDKLFAKIAKDTGPQVVEKVSGDGGESLARAQKEIQQLKQVWMDDCGLCWPPRLPRIAALKAKLAAAEQREQDALAKLKDAQKKPPPAEKAKMPESPSNTGILTDNVDELKQQLERKIARVAELEAELAQAKKDLRAAQRTIDEKDLLLQERARKDADKAKHMSELMEKLRKSEEEAEKLAGKLYRAEEKIKQLKEQIRELKNQLGMPQEQSEEEVEEEVDTGTVFMSRYYLRAKNSGKPRWMLLSEDAKYKSQKKNQDESKQVVGGGPLPVGQMGMGWAGGAQPQEASRAFNFLRKAPGASPSRAGTQVRLQYSFTQASSLAEGPDASPASSQAAGALNRMNTFHTGPLQDNPHSPMATQEAQRLMHSNSMPFSTAGPADSPMARFQGPGGPNHGFGSISRQGTSNSLVPGPNGPNVYVPRANTPPQPHPIYAAGGGSVFHNASWRGGQAAPSTGPAFTSNMAGPMGPAMSNPFRQEGGMPNLGGIRLGTPPMNAAGLQGLQGPSQAAAPAAPAGPAPQHLAARAAPIVEGGSSSLALGGFSQSLGKPSPSGSPGSTRPSDEDIPTSSAGLPLMLPSEAGSASRELRHSSSSLSLSPTSSSRVAHVGLAMIDPMSPQDRPMLQLIPQSGASQDMPFMMDSMEVSAARQGASRTLERQVASWSSFPSSWGLADAGSQGLSPAVVNLSMPQNPSLPSPGPDLSPSQDRVPSKGEGNQVPVHRPMLHSTTVPLDVLDTDFVTSSAPILSIKSWVSWILRAAMAATASPPELRFWRGKDVVPEDVLRTAQGPVGSQELGRTAGVLLASWMTEHRCDQLRWFTFKVLFPLYLLRTLWSISFSLDFVIVLPLSLGFHVLWSQQLSTFTPEAKEVQSESGQPHVVLTGWALLMAQGGVL
eukprot:s149_g9.t1